MPTTEFDQQVTEAAEEAALWTMCNGKNQIAETTAGQSVVGEFSQAVSQRFLMHLAEGHTPEHASDLAISEGVGYLVTWAFDVGRIFQSHGWLPQTTPL